MSFAVTAGSITLPIVEGPQISWNEAALGIIPGALFLAFSFFVFLIGLIFLIRNRKKKALTTPPVNLHQHDQ